MLDIGTLFLGYQGNFRNITGDHKKKKVTIKDKLICNDTFKNVIESFLYLSDIHFKGNIVFYFEAVEFSDDAVILVIESLFYHAIKYLDLRISKVFFRNLQVNRGLYPAYQCSLLNYEGNGLPFYKFLVQNFEKPKSISTDSIRFNSSSFKGNYDEIQSIISADVLQFLTTKFIPNNEAYDIAVVCGELVDNSFSHAKQDIILSLKCFSVLNPAKEEKHLISVSLYNISDICLGGRLREFYFQGKLNEYSQNTIDKAYNNTITKFSTKYDEEAFFMISSFQKNVTSREGRKKSGTGLTELLNLLISNSYDSYCYVLSKRNVLAFDKKYLLIDTDGTIGFNDSGSYFDDIPSEYCFKKMNNSFNGTLYSLILVEDKE